MNTVQRTLAALAVSLAGSFALGATASVHAAGPAGTGAGDPVLQSGGPDISLLNGPTGSVCNLSLHAAPAVNDVPTFTPAQCLSDGIEFGSDVGWPADGGTLDFTVESRDGSQVLYKQMGVYITPSLAPGGSGAGASTRSSRSSLACTKCSSTRRAWSTSTTSR